MGTRGIARSTPAVLLALAGMLAACSSSEKTPTTTSAPNQPGSTQPASPPIASVDNSVIRESVLHNVRRIGNKLISGGVPEGEPAFAELESMGVKTVISVDGATPDVKLAEAHGMRYVHIPITYAEANKEQQIEIARAVRDLPGPIYLHCHHGKHRAPAAAASAAVLLGEVTPDQGVAFMKDAGTAAGYTGLYACVANAAAATAADLEAAPHDFPSIHKPLGMTAAMVDVDHANEHLIEIQKAGWIVPKDHPDLVPAAEAGKLADSLRFAGEDAKVKAMGADFATRLMDAVKKASELEEAIIRNAPRQELENHWKLVSASCKDCHVVYRDVVR